MHSPLEVAAICGLLTLAATQALVLLARRIGFRDRRPPEEVERKPRTEPIPPIGGLAIFIGVLTALPYPESEWFILPLALALLLGAIDDAVGLPWLVKLLGQFMVAVTLDPSYGLLFVIALVAQNAMNTYDNADGAATSLTAMALAGAALMGASHLAPWAVASVLAFLLFNVPRRGRTVPSAYLGDAGSHLLGVMIALEPGAWPFLTLPLLDLARLTVVRLRCGSRPWIGDRRHLAHRLQARGASPWGVLGLLSAIAVPPLPLALWVDPLYAAVLGAGLTAVLYCVALFLTPATDAAGKPLGADPQ
ncbi:MAG: hypothetical protein GY711_30350 [bacterium]|nr:hypothetical protein [bacterium]